jgi:hypothetical protein
LESGKKTANIGKEIRVEVLRGFYSFKNSFGKGENHESANMGFGLFSCDNLGRVFSSWRQIYTGGTNRTKIR